MFILLSFLWKLLCGIGAGINSTAAFAIIATHFRHDREKTIGMMESSSGIGLLIGPFMGAMLYSIGGYVLPFFTTGIKYYFYNNTYILTILSFYSWGISLNVPIDNIHTFVNLPVRK